MSSISNNFEQVKANLIYGVSMTGKFLLCHIQR